MEPSALLSWGRRQSFHNQGAQNNNLSGFSNDEITDIIADIACFWA